MRADSEVTSGSSALALTDTSLECLDSNTVGELSQIGGGQGVFAETAMTRQIGPIPSFQGALEKLRFKGNSALNTTGTGLSECKLTALSQFSSAYFPSSRKAWLANSVIAAVRASLSLRDPTQPRYSKFIHGQRDVLAGGQLKPMPSFLHSLQGTGFLFAGPTGTGKTAFIQRLRACIGEEHSIVRLGGAAPAEMRFLPVLYVRWPDCSTLPGLLANIRNALLSEFGSADTDERALANFSGKHGSQAAIATCILLNVGLFVIDGGSIRSLRSDYREILSFVATLQEYSGIPTIVSCTYPLAQAISRLGGRGANQSSAGAEYFDLIPKGKLWTSHCQFAWKLGQFDHKTDIPEHLAQTVWDCSLGNLRIATRSFIAIHRAIINNPGLAASEAFSRKVALALLETELRTFAEPLDVVRQFGKDGHVPDADLWVHGDYLPFQAFNDMPSRDTEQSRRLRPRK
jgi:hypothetical protein